MAVKKQKVRRKSLKKKKTALPASKFKFTDGFWIADTLGNFLNANTVFCRMLGYKRSELLQMNLLEINANPQPLVVIRHLHDIVNNGSDHFITQYRCKKGAITEVVVEAEYLKRSGGKIFAVLRPKAINQVIKEKTEGQDQINLDLKERLSESYRQLGMVNRKIPLLLELGRFPRSEKHKQKIIDYVFKLVINISGADTGFLYRANGKGEFGLLAAKGIEKNIIRKISVISPKTLGLLKELIKVKTRMNGDIKQHDVAQLAMDSKLAYFVTLPLSRGNSLKGLIFLGFSTKKKMETQELEFLDVFSMHTSSALLTAKVLG